MSSHLSSSSAADIQQLLFAVARVAHQSRRQCSELPPHSTGSSPDQTSKNAALLFDLKRQARAQLNFGQVDCHPSTTDLDYLVGRQPLCSGLLVLTVPGEQWPP